MQKKKRSKALPHCYIYPWVDLPALEQDPKEAQMCTTILRALLNPPHCEESSFVWSFAESSTTYFANSLQEASGWMHRQEPRSNAGVLSVKYFSGKMGEKTRALITVVEAVRTTMVERVRIWQLLVLTWRPKMKDLQGWTCGPTQIARTRPKVYIHIL